MNKLRMKAFMTKGKLLVKFLVIVVSFQISASVGWAAVNVAIFPFKVESDEDITYLKDGILDMLSSRIALSGEIYVVEQSQTKEIIEEKNGELDLETIQSIGYQLDSDYIIMGVLTKSGDSLSIDGEVITIKKKEAPLKFSIDSIEMDKVITKVLLLADDLRKKIVELQNKTDYNEPLLPGSKEKSFREERILPGEPAGSGGSKILDLESLSEKSEGDFLE